ncbi:type II secretion system F family protein [Pasteurella multocida]|nr:type II secretion system F family protein [Pasteurella multocida]
MKKLKMFRWKGINRLQQIQKGVIVAESKEIAQQSLLLQGVQQLHLQRNWQLSMQPKYTEICDLLMQLAMLLQASVPLKESLQLLQRHASHIELTQWLRQLLCSLESGFSFSTALATQDCYLTKQEYQLISVGESTGKLPLVCAQLAKQRQQSLALRRKVQKMLFYPMLVLAVTLILTLLLLLFIVPQFAEIYANQPLPAFTVLLLNISTGLRGYAFQLSLLLIFGFIFLMLNVKQRVGLYRLKNCLLHFIPIFKQIAQHHELIHFCRHLHLMLSSGMPLQQALLTFLPTQKSGIAKHVLTEMRLAEEVQLMLKGIAQGYTFSEVIGSNLFPEMAQQMLHVGEQTGRLSEMLQYIAESYQQKLEHQLDLLSQLLEPCLMLVIGSIIGVILLGMYLPMFNMGALV